MGNCLRHKSTAVWAGDDWGSLESKSRQGDDGVGDAKDTDGSMEKLKLLSSSSGDHGSRKVKIRVSKKELEKLVGLQGLPLEQVLSRFMINGRDHPDLGPQLEHQRSWRPVLQSIPEVD